jgi:hypothetical protein
MKIRENDNDKLRREILRLREALLDKKAEVPTVDLKKLRDEVIIRPVDSGQFVRIEY